MRQHSLNKPIIRVFVYGTLKKGQKNHHWLEEGAAYLGDAATDPEYTMVDLGPFPAVKKVGTTQIKGEVYQITQEVLGELDYLEGYPNHYDREEIQTEFGPAWLYFQSLKPDDFTSKVAVIRNGEWT